MKVGYVVESPIWKTTYRLVLGADDKATLQGWALVENTTDDDWNNVRMSLVCGRPISFQMDLYQPLYVPRPTVEPERFASLRPPTYGGAMTNPGQATAVGGVGGALGALERPRRRRRDRGRRRLGRQFAGAMGFAGGNNFSNQGFGGGGLPYNRYQLGNQIGIQGGNASTFNNANVQTDDSNSGTI